MGFAVVKLFVMPQEFPFRNITRFWRFSIQLRDFVSLPSFSRLNSMWSIVDSNNFDFLEQRFVDALLFDVNK